MATRKMLVGERRLGVSRTAQMMTLVMTVMRINVGGCYGNAVHLSGTLHPKQ